MSVLWTFTPPGRTMLPLQRMQEALQSSSDARRLCVALVTSRYHIDVTDSMRQAAIDAFTTSGGMERDLHQFDAPGTFELTAICRALAIQHDRLQRPVFDAIVALGCILTGETTHDQYIAQSVVQGITAITVQTGVPIAFGVLTCQTIEQARARSVHAKTPQQNKGAEAMMAAIAAANTIRTIRTTQGLH